MTAYDLSFHVFMVPKYETNKHFPYCSLKELNLATILYNMHWRWYVNNLFTLTFSSRPTGLHISDDCYCFASLHRSLKMNIASALLHTREESAQHASQSFGLFLHNQKKCLLILANYILISLIICLGGERELQNLSRYE